MSESEGSGNRYRFAKPDKDKPRLKFPEGARDEWREGWLVQHFDTLADAVAASRFSQKANRNTWADLELGQNPGAAEGESWFGLPQSRAAGVEAVRNAIEHGWPDGVRKMQEALADLGTTATPRSVRRTRRWTDSGDSVEMPRVWAGRVDVAWQRCHRAERTAQQTVTIAANITALKKVDARALFWRGAAVLKLSDLLTDAGYNVRIDAVRHAREAFTNGQGITQRVTVKDHRAPLNLNSLAATVCLSGFFRVVLFQNQCHAGATVRKGMGKSDTYRSTSGEIDGVEHCMSAEAARAWIERSLAQIEGREAIAA